ncbi:tRNA lysidine(34) synthetase TilS [Mobiluncus curtisii]|uniref:tRNA(Ile)-lysidine synthase n=1 Tax=Mobiluncus curtisii ATCC 51333 TaxID=887326 RepID=E6M0W3_9ACTO|nr:tRNA lysidine(34) synthetase TilS [Mobiluncus curtisii]EFU79593.1 tRNA(Ile)-lysidine synthetase [Mobiluncus curtisii ATCC 51333]
MSFLPPFVSPEGSNTRLWERDAGGALGEIQLAVRRMLQSLGSPDDTLLCLALSGGPDSLSLAAALVRVALHHPLPWDVSCFTVDHGWRPESAAESQAAVQCAHELGFTAATVLRGEGRGGANGPEGEARLLRWGLLAQAAISHAKTQGKARAVILTGHTLDDQAETVLLRMARGSSLRSISAMREFESLDCQTGLPLRFAWGEEDSGADAVVDLSLARPLLGIRRVVTHAACEQAGLVAVNDPSNRMEGPVKTAADQPLPRAAIREQVMPALASALGQDPAPALARLAGQAAADDTILEALAGEVFWEVLIDESGDRDREDSVKLNLKAIEDYKYHNLIRYSAPVLRRVVRKASLLAGARVDSLTAAHLRGVVNLIRDWHGQGPLTLPGITVTRRGNFLEFSASQNRSDSKQQPE